MRHWFQDAGLKKVVLFTVVFKLTALIVIAIGAVFFPFHTDNYLANFHYPHDQIPNLFNRFATWDAQHYLYLADHGYEPGLMSNTFYPLFPFLIHCLSYLFLGNTLIAGLFLSTLFTIASMCYLYLLVRKNYGGEAAVRACLLLLAFPMSFFLGLVYADSLFLMLAIAFFYYEKNDKLWPAIICAFLLPFTRPTGVLIAVISFSTVFSNKMPTSKGNFLLRRFYLTTAIALGFVIYLFIMKILTGDYLAGFNAQNYFNSGYSIQNLLHPIDWFLKNFINISYSFNGPMNGVVSRLCFIGFVVGLVFSFKMFVLTFKTVNDDLWFYALVVGLVSALSGDLMSFPRYLVMIFPLFVFLAIKLKDKIPYYLVLSIPLQILLIILYSLNEWVA